MIVSELRSLNLCSASDASLAPHPDIGRGPIIQRNRPPLTFLSNICVDPHTMPNWLHHLADANPISHLVTATRGLIDGTASAAQALWVLAAAAVLTAVFAPLTTLLYQRRG